MGCALAMKVSEKSGKFLWTGNALAIDFVNTEIIQNGARVDLLADSGDLLQWLRESEMLGVEELEEIRHRLSPSRLQQELSCAKGYRTTLRSALERLFKHGTVGRTVLAQTNRLLAAPRSSFVLTGSNKVSRLRHVWLLDESEDVSRPIAFAFADLVTRKDLRRVRKCQNPECILFFLDTSKSGTRLWCSMNICGNKLRVAAFRERQEKA